MSAGRQRAGRLSRWQAGCRALGVAVFLLPAVSCGDSPTAPSATQAEVNVAGDWSGSWTFDVAGVAVADEVAVSLSQSGGAVTGSWSAVSGASGRIDFTATRQVSGTLTINQVTLGGGVCGGSTRVSGTAAADRIDITLEDLPSLGVCRWGTGNRFVLTR